MKNHQNQLTVLLIENDSDWLLEVYSTFQAAGYNVLIATGGDEGFCVARRNLPDLIVSETAMPDISGVQLCYMIRAAEKLRATPFVLIGGDVDIAAEGFRAGADDCFDENCHPQFLEAKAARLIEFQRSEAELRQRRETMRRSESQLAEIIEDASNLAAVLDPALRFTNFGKCDFSESKRFFGNRPSSAGKFLGANRFGNVERETVYYEIVC